MVTLPHTTPAYQRSRGFTLVELLVVIVIIGILVGLLFPIAAAVRNSARKAEAKNGATSLATAVQQFQVEYGVFPDIEGGEAESDAQLMNILTAREGEGQGDDIQNSRQIRFFSGKLAKRPEPDLARNGFDSSDNFRDPYGEFYQLKWDNDYDGEVDDPYGETQQLEVLVWSKGKDKEEDSDTGGDDVQSW